jgi:pentatricopeptide repeat protein
MWVLKDLHNLVSKRALLQARVFRTPEMVTFGRQSWRKELSETGELLLHSILEQDGSLGEILDSARIQEGDLLAILKGLCGFRQWKKALDVFEWMRNHEDHKPNAQAIAVMIRTLGGEAQCSKATDLFHNLRLEGYSMDAYAYTSLISTYSRNGMYREAISLFKRMEEDGCEPECCHLQCNA